MTPFWWEIVIAGLLVALIYSWLLNATLSSGGFPC